MIQYYAKKLHGVKRLFVRFPYNTEMISRLKAIAPCQWSRSEKAWHFDARHDVFEKLKAAFPDIKPLTEGATAQYRNDKTNFKTARPAPGKVRVIQYASGRYRIVALYNELMVNIVRHFPFAQYDKVNKWWSVAIEEKQKKALGDFCEMQKLELVWEDEQRHQKLKARPNSFEISNYRACPDEMLQKLEVMRYSSNTTGSYTHMFE